MYSVHWAMVNNYSTVHCFLFCFPFTIYLFTITTVFGSAHRIDANMVMFYRGDCRCQQVQFATFSVKDFHHWKRNFKSGPDTTFHFWFKAEILWLFSRSQNNQNFLHKFFWSAANLKKIQLYLGMFGSGSGKINRILRFRICHVLGSRYKVCSEKKLR